MTDYTELVEALRICSSELNCGDCPLLYRDSCSSDELMADAAAAIEELKNALADEYKDSEYIVSELESCVRTLAEQRDYWKDKAEKIEPKRGRVEQSRGCLSACGNVW